jgi:hypothetical protein
MENKKAVTALLELATVLVAVYAQRSSGSEQLKADFHLKVFKGASWAASRLGTLAMNSELRYRREVGN